MEAATFLKEQKIFVKVNKSLSYHKVYGELEIGDYFPPNIYIFHNGYPSQSLLSTDGAFHGTNEVQLSLEISNYQKEEAGEYCIIVCTDPCNLFCGFSHCDDDDDSRSFHDLNMCQAILYTEMLHIYTAGKAIIYYCYEVCICTIFCITKLGQPISNPSSIRSVGHC